MRIRRFPIPCTVLPLAGMKIAVCADLHNRDGRAAAELLKKHRPDLICAPGDIFQESDHFSLNECFNQRGLDFLAACANIAPVYYSLGNHERGMTQQNRTILADTGVHLLDNTWLPCHSMLIGGLSSGYVPGVAKQRNTPPPDIEFIRKFDLQRAEFKLLLCHHPEYWRPYIRETSVNLTLSGHAHGGQWQIPFTNQGIYAPGQHLFPKYTSGVYENRLAVSRGMSNTVGIPRFFNPREILMLELVAE